MNLDDPSNRLEHILDSIEDEKLDITDRVEVYQNGKTFECDCGQGIGVELDRIYVSCASCGTVLYDTKASEREPSSVDSGQTTIGQWG